MHFGRLSEVIEHKSVLEITTVHNHYHDSALRARKCIAGKYKLIELSQYLKEGYSFNGLFSYRSLSISRSGMEDIFALVLQHDVIIMHSWKGRDWSRIARYCSSMGKTVIFMNDMCNRYRWYFPAAWVRSLYDRLITRPMLNKLKSYYLIALSNDHKTLLSDRFKTHRIVMHTWHLAYIEDLMLNLATSRIPAKDKPFTIIYRARRIRRKNLQVFRRIAMMHACIDKSVRYRAYTNVVKAKDATSDSYVLHNIEAIDQSYLAYQDADATICPFENEPLGLVPLEALAFGSALVAYANIPSLSSFPDYYYCLDKGRANELTAVRHIVQSQITNRSERLRRIERFRNAVKLSMHL